MSSQGRKTRPGSRQQPRHLGRKGVLPRTILDASLRGVGEDKAQFGKTRSRQDGLPLCDGVQTPLHALHQFNGLHRLPVKDATLDNVVQAILVVDPAAGLNAAAGLDNLNRTVKA